MNIEKQWSYETDKKKIYIYMPNKTCKSPAHVLYFQNVSWPLSLAKSPGHISRSEQAPGSGFHPCDESDKIYYEFLGPSWCKKKATPTLL